MTVAKPPPESSTVTLEPPIEVTSGGGVNDVFVVRAVVVGLIAVALVCVLAVAWLVDHGKDAGPLITLGSVAVGALAAVLSSTRSSR